MDGVEYLPPQAKSDSVKRKFNHNAFPFVPAPQNPVRPSAPLLSFIVEFANLPLDEDIGALSSLIDQHVGILKNSSQQPNQQQFRILTFSHGRATVEFPNSILSQAIINALNGTYWKSCKIMVQLLHAPKVMPPPLYYVTPPYMEYPYSYPMPYHYPASSPLDLRRLLLRLAESKSQSSRHSSLLLQMGSRQNSLASLLRGTVPENADDLETCSAEAENDDGMITITDEEGALVRVNPRRLFVGNIPFSTSWSTLKNFLVSKANAEEPGNSINIEKVKIPMRQPKLAFFNPYPFFPIQPTGLPYGFRNLTRGVSRGFAIVTTKDSYSLEKLIQLFDGTEFENRPLTVKYDRFPDINDTAGSY